MMADAMGTSHRIWDRQIPALQDRYRLLRYDLRGLGDTDAPPGPYTLFQFVSDGVAVMDALDLDKVHWVGNSTGGMIGQGLGILQPIVSPHSRFVTRRPNGPNGFANE